MDRNVVKRGGLNASEIVYPDGSLRVPLEVESTRTLASKCNTKCHVE